MVTATPPALTAADFVSLSDPELDRLMANRHAPRSWVDFSLSFFSGGGAAGGGGDARRDAGRDGGSGPFPPGGSA